MIFVPTKLQEEIRFIIECDIRFISITEKQKISLNKTLLSLWYFIYNTQRDDETITNLSGYTNINKKSLTNFNIKMGNNRLIYSDLLKLLNGKVIDINTKYSPGNFAMGYRIKTDFINGKYTEVELDFEKIFTNIKNKSYWLNKYPSYKKLINDTYEVKVELSDYITWLNNNIGLELKPVIINGVLNKRFLTKETIYDYINDALKVNYSNIWFKVSDEGRFYNSTTNLSYTSLPFIKLKRRSLVEIDITNCQPLLLCGLISNKLYKQDVEKGIFYENISRELNISRNEFKVLSYKYIFFSKKPLKSGKIYNALEKLYPGFIYEMNELRSKIEVSKEMQKIESNIFVNKIGSLDFKMMLRHDAVFVYEEDYDIVKSYIIQEFKNIGLNTKIKIKFNNSL